MNVWALQHPGPGTSGTSHPGAPFWRHRDKRLWCKAMGFLTSWFPVLWRGASSRFASPSLAEKRQSPFFLLLLAPGLVMVLGRCFMQDLHFKPGKRRHQRDPGHATITRFHSAIKALSPRTVLGNGLTQQRSPGLDGKQTLSEFLRLPHQIPPCPLGGGSAMEEHGDGKCPLPGQGTW